MSRLSSDALLLYVKNQETDTRSTAHAKIRRKNVPFPKPLVHEQNWHKWWVITTDERYDFHWKRLTEILHTRNVRNVRNAINGQLTTVDRRKPSDLRTKEKQTTNIHNNRANSSVERMRDRTDHVLAS